MIKRLLCALPLALGLAQGAFAQLTIEGVSAGMETTLRGQISQLEDNCSASEARARGISRQSLSESRDILKALGYYQPKIEQSLARDAEGCWQATLKIDPGPATHIVAIDVQIQGDAEADAAFVELLRNPPFTQGDRLDHGRYDAYKAQFERLAVRRGYYDARFSISEIRVDPVLTEASIVLHYDSGIRYHYGDTTIEEAGPSVEFVSRYVPFKSGDPVDSSQLVELQRRLIDSQYFAAVSVRPQIAQRHNGQVDVQVSLQPVKTWHFSVGLGIDTNSGPRTSLAVENRLLNPQGDGASAEMSLSPKRKQFEISHRHPLEDPTREFRQWKFGVLDEQTDTSDSTRQSIGWSRVRALDSGWARTLGIGYRREISEIGSLRVKSELFLPTWALQKRSATGDRRITRGWRANLDLSFAAKNVLSDTSLIQVHAQTKGIITVGPGRLISRLELGSTWVDEFSEVPASIRYFAGGDNSVRGYDFETLGPRDDEGNVVGGRHLVVGSLEFDTPISENWDAALFVDAGDAFNNEPKLKQSVGVGVRWHTLVGTIRLDLAVPSDGSGLRLHIFMGPEL
jgi:translocation and assembly module TamA